MRKMLVCGGRDFSDRNLLSKGMNEAARRLGVEDPTKITVIHGDARGADKLAGAIAARAGAIVVACPADWDRHGKRAGFLRNRSMLVDHEPDIVVAAPGGRGTANMICLARDAGVPVLELSTGAEDAQNAQNARQTRRTTTDTAGE